MEELLNTLLADKYQELFVVSIMGVLILAITLLLVIPMSKVRAIRNQLLDLKYLLSKKDQEITQLKREKKAIKTKNSLIEEKLIHFDELLLELDAYKTELAEKQEYIITLDERNQQHIEAYQILLQESSDISFKFKSIQKRNEVLVEENSQLRTENKKVLATVEEQANRIFDAIRTNSTQNRRSEMEQLASEFFVSNQKLYETIEKRSIHTNLLPSADRVIKSQEELFYLYEKHTDSQSDLIANINRYQKIDQEIEIFYTRFSKEEQLQNLGEKATEYILKASKIAKKYIKKEEKVANYRISMTEEREIEIELDANFSLISYQNYREKEGRIEKEQALNAYLEICEEHLMRLIERQDGENYSLMFLPSKTALTLLLKHRSHLFNTSYKKRVLLVHPTTLLVTLQRIVTLLEHQEEQRQAKSLEIISQEFYQSLADYHKDMNNLSQELQMMQSRLSSAHEDYTNQNKEI